MKNSLISEYDKLLLCKRAIIETMNSKIFVISNIPVIEVSQGSSQILLQDCGILFITQEAFDKYTIPTI
jgi:hypothetical protein